MLQSCKSSTSNNHPGIQVQWCFQWWGRECCHQTLIFNWGQTLHAHKISQTAKWSVDNSAALPLTAAFASMTSRPQASKTVTGKKNLVLKAKHSFSVLHTKLILQAGGADGRGLVLRTLQVCASIPGQQGGACAQYSHLWRGSGWLTLHLGWRRLGGLAENLLKTVENRRRRGKSENWTATRCPPRAFVLCNGRLWV